MRADYLVLLSLAFPIAVQGQNAPTQAFREWARDHVHPIWSVAEDTHDDTDMQTLSSIIGGAHVAAFGEPIHGEHEPLAMRNRLIRYGVTRLGFTAVALETCLSSSKRLYDYVLGQTTETESGLNEAFCYGFGDLPEDLELIRWLRTYNAAQQPARQVRLYELGRLGFPASSLSSTPAAYLARVPAPAFARNRRAPNRWSWTRGFDTRPRAADSRRR